MTLDGAQPSSSVHDLEHAYQASFDAAIAHFVAGLRTGRPFETDGTENLATLKLVRDVYAAAGLAA